MNRSTDVADREPGTRRTAVPRRRTLAASALAGVATVAALHGSAIAAPRVDDTMAQRVLACTGCHGPQGRAARDGFYPRIAGKPAGYLYQQLLAFRDGRRQYGPMATLLAPLGDAYLREIADHFAGLDLPYPPPQPPAAPAADLARGEALVVRGDAARALPACVTCHGTALTGVAPAIPGLVGMPRDYLNAQLGAWKTGNRRATAPDCMAAVAERLTPTDIAAISNWLAAQPMPADPKPVPAARLASGGPGVAAGADAKAGPGATATTATATATSHTGGGLRLPLPCGSVAPGIGALRP